MARTIYTGEKIQQTRIPCRTFKGIQLNYQRAGVKALENAASKVKESILPDLIEHIRK